MLPGVIQVIWENNRTKTTYDGIYLSLNREVNIDDEFAIEFQQESFAHKLNYITFLKQEA
jgi:hypothetical protein